MPGRVFQLNIKPLIGVEPGLPKLPVDSALLTKAGFEGDYNRYRQEKKSGSPAMAALVMPLETLEDLSKEGWPVKPGDIGENITTSGLAYSDFSIEKKFKVGASAVIEISEPCIPCATLKALPYVGPEKISEFIRLMLGRRGWYARVLAEGVVGRGDVIAPA